MRSSEKTLSSNVDSSLGATIVVIPARGGSKGIPRKNLRPVAGKPLIFYSIDASLKARGVDEVIVSTDDDEIALFGERFGALALMRDPSLAGDKITLDPVIEFAVKDFEEKTQQKVGLVITVQPTSPLVRSSDIERCIEIFTQEKDIDTVLSVVDDRHLCWTVADGKPVPVYKNRVNRQQLAPNFKETGAIIACKRNVLETGSRIGKKIELLEMPQDRSFDIDSVTDLVLCESILQRKRIVFTVVGYPTVGLGHVFRALMLANELVKQELIFVCEESSELAATHLLNSNYRVERCTDGCLLEKVLELDPDLVINDILDTTAEYILGLKQKGIKVVNFEDLGSGIEQADLVINALYPDELPHAHVKVGHRYFCLRDEFLFHERNQGDKSVRNILISFGGVDEGNLTKRVSELAYEVIKNRNIKLTIITGPGYLHHESILSLGQLPEVEIIKSTSRISDFMAQADLAITSGGRTVLELSAMQVPTIVICQNKRETTHTFASSENGIVNLGLRTEVNDAEIVGTIEKVIDDFSVRMNMVERMRELELRSGKERVCKLILDLLG